MQKRLVAILIAAALAVPVVMAVRPVAASPADEYSGPHFGADNLPQGCVRDMSANNPDNICHHMRTGMNGLDSPKVDVLVLVPATATAERDMRIMRQSVEMWEAGIDYLADQMGLQWLGQGLDFHITVDAIDPDNGGEFTTYPIVDPEIVIVATTNPVGALGIGIDPLANAGVEGPCHGVQNPFDFEAWDNLPGFNSHHEGRSGTYVEDCGGAGGNVCFAVNTALDPAPDTIDLISLYDIVSHEFGHCLTIGHVGDGAEGDWGAVPTNDIMAYNSDPPGLNKCVSTLDVEGIAVTMSKYIDVNGDGDVDLDDLLLANDQIGDGSDAFQVQHPADHLYASATGAPTDCPQPDLGLVPGPRTDWTPEPVPTSRRDLTVTSPQDGATSSDGVFRVTGTVEKVSLSTEPVPSATSGSYDDADDDASTPLTEILELDVAVTPTHVDATIALADLWPSTDATSATSYSLVVDGRAFDSFVRYPAVDANPVTWDTGAGAYMPDGTSTWDTGAKTVSFHIPRDYLSDAGVVAPYYVGSTANHGSLAATVPDDHAPDAGGTVPVAGANASLLGLGPVSRYASTTNFEHPDGNTFTTEDSTLGVPDLLVESAAHHHGLEVPRTSTVELTLTWTDTTGGGNDLDLHVSGAAASTDGATADNPEHVVLENVKGFLDITVDPYLVADVAEGTTYTLTGVVTPAEAGPDTDGDGLPDAEDACPAVAGDGPDGCPVPPAEQVHVSVDGVRAASQAVDTSAGPDAFDLSVTVPPGTHELRIDWEDRGRIVATETVTVTHGRGRGRRGVRP